MLVFIPITEAVCMLEGLKLVSMTIDMWTGSIKFYLHSYLCRDASSCEIVIQKRSSTQDTCCKNAKEGMHYFDA